MVLGLHGNLYDPGKKSMDTSEYSRHDIQI